MIVGVALQVGHQEVNVRLIVELGDNLDVAIALLDGFIDEYRFSVEHLVVEVALETRVHSEDHDLVRIIDVCLQVGLLVQGRPDDPVDILVLSNLVE